MKGSVVPSARVRIILVAFSISVPSGHFSVRVMSQVSAPFILHAMSRRARPSSFAASSLFRLKVRVYFGALGLWMVVFRVISMDLSGVRRVRRFRM